MSKLLWTLIGLNFILILSLIGTNITWMMSLIIVLSIIGLAVLGIPSFAFFFILKKYNQLRKAHDVLFSYYLGLQQQLKIVDQMQITNLQIVNLKQKVGKLKKMMADQKMRRKNDAKK